MTKNKNHRFWKFLARANYKGLIVLTLFIAMIAALTFTLTNFKLASAYPNKPEYCSSCHGLDPNTLISVTVVSETDTEITYYVSGSDNYNSEEGWAVFDPAGNNIAHGYNPGTFTLPKDGQTYRVYWVDDADNDETAPDSGKGGSAYEDITTPLPPPPPNQPPVASFTESAEVVDTGVTITFDASASHDPDGTIVSYEWDFGDGTTATGVTTTHSYIDDGTYTVNLTVTDDDGATAWTTATKTVLNRPPVALFTENATTVLVGETIHFDASESYDPDGTIVSYEWDFGDGTSDTGVTTDHSYSSAGTYTVTLTVTDDDDATAQADATKTVSVPVNIPPVASFTENATTVLTGEAIHFDASSSSDPDGTIVSYFWDFGDGNTASGVAVDHSYADDGVYTVTLTVTDDLGATDSATATKTVLNREPTASFTESATTVLVGETIAFDASGSSDPDGTIVSYVWDFGDGSTATGVTTSHAYTAHGNYTVTLTVTDDDGATATTNATKTVLSPPVASFTEDPVTPLVGETVTFTSTSYDPDGTIVSWDWSFGDGTFGSGEVVTHVYTVAGEYTVTLTVTDDDGLTASVSEVKTVLALQEASAQLVGVGRKPGSILPGGILTLKARVKNTGTLNVTFKVEFVIKDPNGDVVGEVNTTETVEKVGDGPLWVSTSWQVPSDASAGTYTVEATLYYKAVGDTEWITGNTLTLTFKVR